MAAPSAGNRPREEPGEVRGGGTPPVRADRCELCGGPVEERHCKIVCRNCGFLRDCSDP